MADGNVVYIGIFRQPTRMSSVNKALRFIGQTVSRTEQTYQMRVCQRTLRSMVRLNMCCAQVQRSRSEGDGVRLKSARARASYNVMASTHYSLTVFRLDFGFSYGIMCTLDGWGLAQWTVGPVQSHSARPGPP